MKRDYGMHTVISQGVKLTCKYVAPGVTMQDVSRAYARGKAKAKPGDEFAGNPSRWPTHRGLAEVVDLLVEAFENEQ
jgi:hypothetical protein